MAWLWSLLAALGKALIGRFLGAQDERDKEREAGEKLGRAEVAADTGRKELDYAQLSKDAARAAVAADDAGGLREPHEGDRPWRPDDLG